MSETRKRYVPLRHGALSSPQKPKTQAVQIAYFRGDDLGRSPATVDPSRSPESCNMLRDELGQLRKRMGYHTVAHYGGAINGAYRFGGASLIHAGYRLYEGETALGAMANRRSCAQRLGGALWLLDGTALRRLTGTQGDFSLVNARSAAYVPTVVISRSPSGGGAAYEEYNLLSRYFINSFLAEAGATVFQLTDDELDDDAALTVRVLSASGVWVRKTENTDYTVDRRTGTVTFAAAPGAPLVAGEDNVRITAAKTREGYAARIDGCTVSALYGVGGVPDRLFVGGNPDYPGQDWYSAQNDPSMFGDLSYSVLGQGDAPIVGYSIVSDRLAAHRGDAADGRSVVLRTGRLDENGQAAFPLTGTLQGPGAIAPHALAYLGNDPIFLTRSGVYALTASDMTGERVTEARSALLNARLLREEAPEEACAVVFHGFYLLCVNGHVYALDSLQKTRAAEEPASSHQYEGYYLEGIPARTIWTQDDVLYFGTGSGDVKAFYTDKTAQESYNDDGAAIRAYWDTPYFAGAIRHTRKVFRYLSVTLAPAVATSLTVYAKRYGIWQELFCDRSSARYFDFRRLDFEKFSFSTDTSPINIRKRLGVPVTDKAMLRLENNECNEPFGIYDLTLEYTEAGKL